MQRYQSAIHLNKSSGQKCKQMSWTVSYSLKHSNSRLKIQGLPLSQIICVPRDLSSHSHITETHHGGFDTALFIPHRALCRHTHQLQHYFSPTRHQSNALLQLLPFCPWRQEAESKNLWSQAIYCPFMIHNSSLSTRVLSPCRIACMPITGSAIASNSMDINIL